MIAAGSSFSLEEDVKKEEIELTEQITGMLMSHHLSKPKDFALSA